MEVEQIISETKNRYSGFHCYEDRGFFEQERYGRVYRSWFRTAFVKPNKLLFESGHCKPEVGHQAPLEKFGARLILDDGRGELRYSHAIFRIDQVRMALSSISSMESFSQRTINIVVPLLVPELSLRSVIDDTFVLLPSHPDLDPDKDNYFHLWSSSTRVHIWISKSDFMIRRFQQEHPNPKSPFKTLWSETFPTFAVENAGDLNTCFEDVHVDEPMKVNFSFEDYVSEPIAKEATCELLKKTFLR